jgi:hypothetical protein
VGAISGLEWEETGKKYESSARLWVFLICGVCRQRGIPTIVRRVCPIASCPPW